MPNQRDKDVTPRLPAHWWKQVAQKSALPTKPTQPSGSPAKPYGFWQFVRLLLRVFIWPIVVALNTVLSVAVGVLILYIWIIPTLPKDSALADVGLLQPLLIYNATGQLMGEFGVQRRDPIRYVDTPPLLVKAFLAAEDNRFFEHAGIDLHGLARAALNLVLTGEPSQGGSTITMQLVRNLFLTPEKTMQRKFSELILAMHLETRFSKEQIFELYQNRIFFGHQAYGVAAAAHIYYNKKVNELTLAQMATLAGIPQAPSVHNPVTNPQRALVRRSYVLNRMLALKWITTDEYATANTIPDDAHLTPTKIEYNAPYLAEMARREALKRFGDKVFTSGLRITTTIDPHIQDIAQRAVITTLVAYDQRHGYRGAEAHIDPNSSKEALDGLLASHHPLGGLVPAIVLNLTSNNAHVYLGAGQELDLPGTAASWAISPAKSKNSAGLTTILKPGDLIRLSKGTTGNLQLAQIPKVEGALAVVAPTDGAIMALVGGFDFHRSQFNRAVDARRQPGSSFKPFVYAAALAQGFTPTSLIKDSPLQVRNGRRVWRPKNIDGRYLGSISLRDALAQSRNLAAVQLLRKLGIETTRNFIADHFGFRLEQIPRGLSMVLGSGHANPLQMAGAYARFANNGLRVDPYLIATIRDPSGKITFQANALSTCKDCTTITQPKDGLATTNVPVAPIESAASVGTERVLESTVAATMVDLLQEVIRTGTGKRALALNIPGLAGKTGTSNDVRDAWFCGFNTKLVVVAWVGHDDFSPLGDDEMGGHSALDMWMAFMGEALKPQVPIAPHVTPVAVPSVQPMDHAKPETPTQPENGPTLDNAPNSGPDIIQEEIGDEPLPATPIPPEPTPTIAPTQDP